jgi:hypothetical protein
VKFGEIEKGVPLPAPRPKGRPRQYRFDLMEVGDSIVCRSSSAPVCFKRRNPGWNYTIRPEPAGGFRVWCTTSLAEHTPVRLSDLKPRRVSPLGK